LQARADCRKHSRRVFENCDRRKAEERDANVGEIFFGSRRQLWPLLDLDRETGSINIVADDPAIDRMASAGCPSIDASPARMWSETGFRRRGDLA
jgi:hypothetical protein